MAEHPCPHCREEIEAPDGLADLPRGCPKCATSFEGGTTSSLASAANVRGGDGDLELLVAAAREETESPPAPAWEDACEQRATKGDQGPSAPPATTDTGKGAAVGAFFGGLVAIVVHNTLRTGWLLDGVFIFAGSVVGSLVSLAAGARRSTRPRPGAARRARRKAAADAAPGIRTPTCGEPVAEGSDKLGDGLPEGPADISCRRQLWVGRYVALLLAGLFGGLIFLLLRPHFVRPYPDMLARTAIDDRPYWDHGRMAEEEAERKEFRERLARYDAATFSTRGLEMAAAGFFFCALGGVIGLCRFLPGSAPKEPVARVAFVMLWVICAAMILLGILLFGNGLLTPR
jgi:hypothetical protein